MKKSTDKILQFTAIIFISMWFSIVITNYIPTFPYIAFYLGIGLLTIWILDMIYHILRLRRFLKRIEGRIEYLYLIIMVILLTTALTIQVEPVKATLLMLTPMQIPIESVAIGLLPSISLITIIFATLLITVVTRSYYRTKYRELKEKQSTS